MQQNSVQVYHPRPANFELAREGGQLTPRTRPLQDRVCGRLPEPQEKCDKRLACPKAGTLIHTEPGEKQRGKRGGPELNYLGT